MDIIIWFIIIAWLFNFITNRNSIKKRIEELEELVTLQIENIKIIRSNQDILQQQNEQLQDQFISYSQQIGALTQIRNSFTNGHSSLLNLTPQVSNIIEPTENSEFTENPEFTEPASTEDRRRIINLDKD